MPNRTELSQGITEEDKALDGVLGASTEEDKRDMKPGSNHHPLSRFDVAGLLREAAAISPDDESGSTKIARIQQRLYQAIPEMSVIQPIVGPIADKKNQLGELFLQEYHRGDDPALVDEIYELLGAEGE